MRRSLLPLAAALALGACSRDASEPLATDQTNTYTADFSSVAYGLDGSIPPAILNELWRLKNLPENSKLSAEQEAAISKLLDDFQKANDADLKALARVLDEARKAIEAGKTRAEVAALLQQAAVINLRMRVALARLRTDLHAVLTTEQKAWLAAHSPPRCDPAGVPPLTEAQRTSIKTLRDAYMSATAADRAQVAAALEAARNARRLGKTPDEIKAILDPVRDAMTRLQAAGDKLRADVWAVLTPAQRASGCFGPAPRTGT